MVCHKFIHEVRYAPGMLLLLLLEFTKYNLTSFTSHYKFYIREIYHMTDGHHVYIHIFRKPMAEQGGCPNNRRSKIQNGCLSTAICSPDDYEMG